MYKYCFINPTPNMVWLSQSKFFQEHDVHYAYIGEVFKYSFARIYHMQKGYFSFAEIDQIPGDLAFNPIAEHSFTVLPGKFSYLAPFSSLRRKKRKDSEVTKDIMLDRGGYSIVSYEHIPYQRSGRQDSSAPLITASKQEAKDESGARFDPSKVETFASMDALQKKYGKAIYIASGIIDDSDKSLSLQIYSSSLDIEKTLGEHYYISSITGSRIDFFVRNGNLHIISESEKGLSAFSALYPIAMDYSFDLVKSHGLRVNSSRSLLQNKGVYYIDDYSYFNMSLHLSENYYSQLAKNFTSAKFLKYNNKKY